MNEFQFDHLKNRRRVRLPRPVLYVGVAIILLAFFSIKWFQRAGETDPAAGGDSPESVVVVAPERAAEDLPSLPGEPPAGAGPLSVPDVEGEEPGGILSLDGSGKRIKPPRRISGQRPDIPASLLSSGSLDNPRVYVRVGKDGMVTDLKLVSTSGSVDVDRLVLDALAEYTFQPARSAGQPVEFSSVVTVPLRTDGDASP